MTATNKKDQEVAQEFALLQVQCLQVLKAWGMLENVLAGLLQQILSPGGKPKPYGFAVYFAPNGSEIRLAIVNAIIKQFFRGHEAEPAFMAAWKVLVARIGTLRGARNKVAHGEVSVMRIRGKPYARLTGPMFDLTSWPIGGTQIPGMSLADVSSACIRIACASSAVFAVEMIVQAIQLKAHDGDTLLDLCRELEESLKKADTPVFLTRIALQVPPQSSPP